MQSKSSFYFKTLLILVLLFSCYIGLLVLNPKSIGAIDSLILRAPCCENEVTGNFLSFPNIFLWKLISLSYRISRMESIFDLLNLQFDKETCCALCRQYQTFRCHLRTEELILEPFNWHQFTLKNATLNSSRHCNFENLPEKYYHFFPSFLFYGRNHSINALETSFVEIKSIIEESRQPLPAVQVEDFSIDLNSIFRQVIDVNASGVVINIVTEKDSIRINSSVKVPLTKVKVGDWLLHEIFDLIPSPPEEEGLYPRLGTINLTDVKLVSHLIQDEKTTEEIILIPDEFFYPLYHITNLAGSTDQTLIATVLRKSLIMVLRKHAINEEGFISKSMETFMASMEKCSDFLQEATRLIYKKINEWIGMIDTEINRASDILNRFISRVEQDWNDVVRRLVTKVGQDWNDAMKERDAYLLKLTQEAASFIDVIDENLSKAGHRVYNSFEKIEQEVTQKATSFFESVDENLSKAGHKAMDILEKIEKDFDSISDSSKLILPQLSKEAQGGWYAIQQSFHEVEEDFNTRVKQVKDQIAEALDEATKDAMVKSKEIVGNIHAIKESFHESEANLNSRAKQIEKDVEVILDEVTKDAVKVMMRFKDDLKSYFKSRKDGNSDKNEL